MDAKIALTYTGPAVESGLMDVYEASANMVAFSDFIIAASQAAFGPTVQTRAEVAGFGRGSFVTDLVFNVGGTSASIFTGISLSHLWELVKQSLDLWKHLKGSPPASVTYEGPYVNVANNNGEIIQVQIGALNLTYSDKGSDAVGRFVRTALEKPGMDSVQVDLPETEVQTVTQAESSYFKPVAPAQTITDTVIRMGLTLEAPVFKDGNKWRFSDGQQSFYADIEDGAFLQRVNAGERFGKGDVLIAEVRISQQQTGMKLSAERSIVRVLEHQVAPQQFQL